MDLEAKLDEDFLFYLGFTSTYAQKVKECDRQRTQQWLQKLCGETCNSVDAKRNRNIFLSNLLLDIQDKKLNEPFSLNPDDVDFNDAPKYFPAVATDVETPNWISDVVAGGSPALDEDDTRVDGRTYVATRAMPGGEGAFAYVAVSMCDDPMWLGGGEGEFDKVMKEKYQEYVPPQSEMEMILSRRKDAKERERVITFYDVILENIADELDGKIKTEDNKDVNGFVEQLVNDMQQKGTYGQFSCLDEKERRVELLLALFDRVHARKRQTQTREEVLDTIGADLQASFFEASGVGNEEKYEMPAAMWEYCINRPPGKKSMETLRMEYPANVVEKFLELMANAKEEIAVNMQRRHVNIITQMKGELKNQGIALKNKINEAKFKCDRMEAVAGYVREAYEKQQKSIEAANKRKKGGETQLTGLYEEMKAALLDTQFGVEQEAERGRFLAQQINAVNEQTEKYHEISDRTIMMTEEANMEMIRNLKRLNLAIKQHEGRLNQILKMQQMTRDMKQTNQMFIV